MNIKKRNLLLATIMSCLALSGIGTQASASVVVTIERLSDSTASITGTGTWDTLGSSVRLLGASSTGDNGTDIISGNLTLGGQPFEYTFTASGTTDVVLGGPFSLPGTTFSGTALVTLDVETWAAIGSTGTVENNGSWIVVGERGAVPAPAALGFLGFGLMGLGVMRRRRTIK